MGIPGRLKFTAVVVVPALVWPPVSASPVVAAERASASAGLPAAAGVLTSTGAGLRKQTVTVRVPAGWRMSLAGLDPQYVNTVVVPQGFYTRDASTRVTFTPALGYLGTATPVKIILTGPGGQRRTVSYTPTVTRPRAPAAPDLTSAGPARAAQSVTFEIPAGGSIGYVDAAGRDLADPNLPQGEFALAGASSVGTVPGQPFDPTLIGTVGTVIFTPARGVSGPVPSIRYRVTDAYRQTSIGRYTPTITGYRSQPEQ
jgi:CshA-type fibril repeat protein